MQRKPLVAINVTPLVDVLLILMVILMLAMPLFVKKLPVELPKTGLDAAPVAANSLQVAVDARGTLMLDSKPVLLTQLKPLVHENTTVELAVDEKTPYGVAAGVIAKLQDYGPKEIVLATR
jgi:biopolymer transport protein ExbD